MSQSTQDPPVSRPVDLGTVLLEHGVLAGKDLQYARRVQARMEDPRPLGEILVALRLITRAELKRYLRLYKMKLALGDLLVENGVVSRARLEEARAEQDQRPGRSLGDILVDKGMVSERDLVRALCEQQDLPFVEPSPAMLDEDLLREFSPGYLLEHEILPLTRKGGRIQVLVPRPPDAPTKRELEGFFNAPIELSLGTREQIAGALRDYGELTRQGPRRGRRDDRATGERAVELADSIIGEAIGLGASDIHFEPLHNRMRVRLRIDGVLVHRTDLPKDMEARMIARLKVLAELDITEKRRHQDGRFTFRHDRREYDMRVSTYVTIHGENMVIRILRRQQGILDLEELGMPPRILETFRDHVLTAPAGVAVITGPTGSGKTSTLYSAVDACNDVGVKIITAEDPVEYEIEGIMQCSINPRAGLTFDDTLKALVRQDPDIIVLGEIRDRTSAAVAIQAALTGHKVFTTFHTEDAVGGLLRLMNMEIETFLISSTVICMVAQRLVRTICEGCREAARPSPKSLSLLGVDPAELRDSACSRGRGCEACHYTGYRGRTAIYELLVLDEKVKEAILDQRTSHYIRRVSVEESGLVTLRESGIAKAARGITTFEEVLHHAPPSFRPRPVREIMSRIGEGA